MELDGDTHPSELVSVLNEKRAQRFCLRQIYLRHISVATAITRPSPEWTMGLSSGTVRRWAFVPQGITQKFKDFWHFTSLNKDGGVPVLDLALRIGQCVDG